MDSPPLCPNYGRLRSRATTVPGGRRRSGRFRAPRRAGRGGEGEQGPSPPRAEHAGEEPLGPPAPADRHGDVLPALDHVGGRVAVVAASALELPQLLPGAGVERVELPGGFTGEHQVTAGGQY